VQLQNHFPQAAHPNANTGSSSQFSLIICLAQRDAALLLSFSPKAVFRDLP